jgi:hypothetical protein
MYYYCIKIKIMKKLITLAFSLMFIVVIDAQTHFRSGIFLHHSTGACIWGPNGSSKSVPNEMSLYNNTHSFTGTNAVSMTEEWWAPGDNEWATQHTFFEDPSSVTGIGKYLPDNKIIVIKSCFPSSSIYDAGQPSDTLSPDDKTVYNYKWHWRHIIRVMEQHPENFFVIWTNAPLEPGSTNTDEALLSKWFCKWAKDSLAKGLDAEFGSFPPNVYVFDFFSKLTGPNGMMQTLFRTGDGDSHPNALATELVAPQFVNEIFNAAIAYESIYSSTENFMFFNEFNFFPNPLKYKGEITFTVSENCQAKIFLYSTDGKFVSILYNGLAIKGFNYIDINEPLAVGIYYCQIISGSKITTRKIIVTD